MEPITVRFSPEVMRALEQIAYDNCLSKAQVVRLATNGKLFQYLRDIKIDTSQPVEKKLAAFAEQTKNVYVNRIGDYVVKVRFQESGATIDDKMTEYLRRLSEIYI